MYYYPPHQKECEEVQTYIYQPNTMTTIRNNRALPNDTVSIKDNEVIAIQQRSKSHSSIHGILNIKRTKLYGTDKKGRRYYLFYPQDKSYPHFIVGIQSRKFQSPIYVSISFHIWKTTSKLPIGRIEYIYGRTDDLHSIIKYQMGLYRISQKPYTIPSHVNHIDNEVMLPVIDFTMESNLSICSIDPYGCCDIDDAIHARYMTSSSRYLELGIHIADPTQWFHPFSTDCEKSSTLYTPYGTFLMLDESISYEEASLCEGKKRKSLSLCLYYDTNTKSFVSMKLVQGIIQVRKNTNYDTVDKIITSTKTQENELGWIRDMIQQSNPYIQQHLYSLGVDTSSFSNMENSISKQWIADCMVLTNIMVGYWMTQFRPSYCILRGRDSLEKEEQQVNVSFPSIPSNYHSQVKAFLRKNSTSIEYKRCLQIQHPFLNVNTYTHFTSPIRRRIDCVIHWIIKYPNSVEESSVDMICNKINQQEKIQNQLIRSFERFQFIEEIRKTPSNFIDIDGYIIEKQNSGIVCLCTSSPYERKIITYSFVPNDVRQYLNQVDYIHENNDMIVVGQCVTIRFQIIYDTMQHPYLCPTRLSIN